MEELDLTENQKEQLIEYFNEYLDLRYPTGICCLFLSAGKYASVWNTAGKLLPLAISIAEDLGYDVEPRSAYWVADSNFEHISKEKTIVDVSGAKAYYAFYLNVEHDGRSLKPHADKLSKEVIEDIEKFCEIRRSIIRKLVEVLSDE